MVVRLRTSGLGPPSLPRRRIPSIYTRGCIRPGRKLATLYISPYQKRISGKAPNGFMLAENSFTEAVPVKEVATEPDGTLKYYSCGVLHRDDGPAVIEVYPDYDGQERHRSGTASVYWIVTTVQRWSEGGLQMVNTNGGKPAFDIATMVPQ